MNKCVRSMKAEVANFINYLTVSQFGNAYQKELSKILDLIFYLQKVELSNSRMETSLKLV